MRKNSPVNYFFPHIDSLRELQCILYLHSVWLYQYTDMLGNVSAQFDFRFDFVQFHSKLRVANVLFIEF